MRTAEEGPMVPVPYALPGVRDRYSTRQITMVGRD